MDAYKTVKVRCKRCGEMLEFHYTNRNEPGLGRLVSCKCGAVQVDPAPIAFRIIGEFEDYENMSEKMG